MRRRQSMRFGPSAAHAAVGAVADAPRHGASTAGPSWTNDVRRACADLPSGSGGAETRGSPLRGHVGCDGQ